MQRDYIVDAANIALSAGTAKYMFGMATVAKTPVDVIQVALGCDALVSGLLKIEAVAWTVDGTGTTYTPLPGNSSASLCAANTTAKVNYTVAPTLVFTGN